MEYQKLLSPNFKKAVNGIVWNLKIPRKTQCMLGGGRGGLLSSNYFYTNTNIANLRECWCLGKENTLKIQIPCFFFVDFSLRLTSIEVAISASMLIDVVCKAVTHMCLTLARVVQEFRLKNKQSIVAVFCFGRIRNKQSRANILTKYCHPMIVNIFLL